MTATADWRDRLAPMSAIRKDRDHGHVRVTSMELFFDLVYVFSIIQLSHYLLAHQTWTGAIEAATLFAAVWWAWNYTAWAANWLDPDHPAGRVLMIVLMACALMMAVAMPYAFGARAGLFVGAYVAMALIRAGYAALVMRGQTMGRNYAQLCAWSGFSALFWIAGALVAAAAARAVDDRRADRLRSALCRVLAARPGRDADGDLDAAGPAPARAQPARVHHRARGVDPAARGDAGRPRADRRDARRRGARVPDHRHAVVALLRAHHGRGRARLRARAGSHPARARRARLRARDHGRRRDRGRGGHRGDDRAPARSGAPAGDRDHRRRAAVVSARQRAVPRDGFAAGAGGLPRRRARDRRRGLRRRRGARVEPAARGPACWSCSCC